MGIFNPSFLLGLVILLYLASFVVFAILRIATGISIQRLGYFSLRRIAYTPRDGIRIDLRGLGLTLHRPTFAQPTWLSLRLDEFKLTIDVKAFAVSARQPHLQDAPHGGRDQSKSASASPRPILRRKDTELLKSQAWKRLTSAKEWLKRLHQNIHWLRLVDIFARNSSIVITDVGSFEIGTTIMVVDTRRKTVDRGRLFQHKKVPHGDQRPAEWMFTVKGVLFTAAGRESLEVVDIATLNIHGLLYNDLPGLRDTSITLKVSRIHIPYDDLISCHERVHKLQNQAREENSEKEEDQYSMADVIEELDRPGSREANIVQAVSDSKEFVSSILRGVQEIQMAVSFVGMTKSVNVVQPVGKPFFLNMSMNEFGVDLHRIDPKSPAHRMYFSPKDIAHQALLAAISISVSLDDGREKPEKLLYVPMATTTIKTTLPSKTVSFSEDKDAAERNANMLFANFVVTSPSIDVDPIHVPLVLGLLDQRRSRQDDISSGSVPSHSLLQRLLPKASIKMSVHEPVIRMLLPPADAMLRTTDAYDLLIFSISSISLDTESLHASAGELHYSLTSALRLVSHQFYYQTSVGERHDLLIVESLEVKLQVTASPTVSVTAVGNVQTFSVHMVRPEISAGVRQIFKQLRKEETEDVDAIPQTVSHNPDFLRPLPTWLTQVSFQGSDFGVEVAGVDADVSVDTRGIAFLLESWTAEYRIKREPHEERPPSRRHGTKQEVKASEPEIVVTGPSGKNVFGDTSTDGRRLAVHIRGLEGYALDGADHLESDAFLSLPRFEVAFSTNSDAEGPIYHINTFMKSLYIDYSLYRYYSAGVAVSVLRQAFARDEVPTQSTSIPAREGMADRPDSQSSHKRSATYELVTVDIKSDLVQVKATMAADPPMMFQIYGLEAGQHRWARPFLRSMVFRIYARAPQLPKAWARIVSIKTLRVDFRESRKKRGHIIEEERSFDVTTDYIRIAVPHQMVMHQIFDNFVNITKATAQLHHRFETGKNDYILQKVPEAPKILPRISVRSKALLFDMEDGPFDWKLGMIYRVGLVEQKQRMVREEAFFAKTKGMERLAGRRRSRQRNHSGAEEQAEAARRSRSGDHRGRLRTPRNDARHQSASPQGRQTKRMRYDPEGKCNMSKDAAVSTKEAWQRLQRYNAQSWKQRIDHVCRLQNKGMQEIRGIFWGTDEIPFEDNNEKILSMPERPGLMTALISDLHIVINKPSFPIHEYPTFLHSIGKGMPIDTKYSLLIPMSLQIDMGEARFTLRDYPLPLLHVPAIRPGQSPRLPSWSLKTDFVIAEEFRGDVSTRDIDVQVIPPEKFSNKACGKGFAVDVRRTVSPVKTYSDVNVVINTSGPTTLAWGTSLQPAIQDMMMVIENFTKPQVDPSDRCGFWDKIRLSVHSRVSIIWTGDGDVHFNLKGSRDPYIVTGHGAGFVMVWRKDVRWNIHRDDDPKKFMTVDSGEYILAIPDFSRQAREHREMTNVETDSVSSSNSTRNSAQFKKTIMKLYGDVRWLAGLVFERNLDDGSRSFDFKPHHEVVLRMPEKARELEAQNYDAFKGFRSNHIHMSIAVVAPLNRDWTTTNIEPSLSYNSVHMTPKFFTHFYDWWSTFSGVMSLPIRQGALFPGLEKTSKKFGRHLATIKYNLLLSPLFITHMYKHKDVEEYQDDTVSATGLKLRMDSFMLDLHQRREHFTAKDKGRGRQIKTSAMKMNQAQLDFISADLRAISAKIRGTGVDDIKNATDAELATLSQGVATADLSKFIIPDNNFDWVDMDDFNELDWILPAESNPETKILPMAYSPRFTYFRQTDHPGAISANGSKSSPFGDEPTHFCVMTQDNDPRKVQRQLFQERIAKLEQQMDSHQRLLGEQELHVIRDSTTDRSHKARYEALKQRSHELDEKKAFLLKLLSRLEWAIAHGKSSTAAFTPENHEDMLWDDPTEQGTDRDPVNFDDSLKTRQEVKEFNNRFIVHNVQLKWNNSLRNIILRYVHQVSQRRGFIYYLSRKAVKFILDTVDEQNKNKDRQNGASPSSATRSAASQGDPQSTEDDDSNATADLKDRLDDLLSDARKFVSADETQKPRVSEKRSAQDIKGDDPVKSTANAGREEKTDDLIPLKSYFIHLIAPQIQLQSEKNAKSVLLVTAKNMQLQVIQVMDKNRLADDVSGLVQRHFSIDMDSAQFFVTNTKLLREYHDIYLGNRYGAPQGSSWPPWVPFEVNFNFDSDPFGWHRVVSKTSAALRYDKFNTLRLKYNDEVTTDKDGQKHRVSSAAKIDRMWLHFPHIRAICDSAQYYTMYVIAVDLLLYNEPLEKVRSEKLEKIMLASDFSDLRGAPEMVHDLQTRIQQLADIKTHFQIHSRSLDRQGWQDNLAIEHDLASCEDELFFMMKAITTSQRKTDERVEASQANELLQLHLSASEIVWHLMRRKDEPLMEIEFTDAQYQRSDNSDGSNHNVMEVRRMHGLNLLPNAIYPEMLSPYMENGRSTDLDHQDPKMLRVNWHSLEAIAGIPVLDQFEVDLFPLKIQLERDIGHRVFEYIFPGAGKNGSSDGGFSLKNIAIGHSDSDSDADEDVPISYTPAPEIAVNGSPRQPPASHAASLESRLRPTIRHPEKDRPSSTIARAKPKTPEHPHEHHFRLFQHSNASSRSALQASPAVPSTTRKPSQESLALSRRSGEASASSLAVSNGTQAEKQKRFGLHRTASSATVPSKSKDKEKVPPSDDLSLMLSRASNYMTLAHVKIPSVVLCLSYKGKGDRNIEDVHNFVFRMPVLEYRNKTWSNLDLALRLKKDVIRALISHTGAIIGNKFSNHRPNKAQQTRARDLASSISLMTSSNTMSNSNGSESSSLRARSPGRSSFISAAQSDISRTQSYASSLKGLGIHAGAAHNSSSQLVRDIDEASTPVSADSRLHDTSSQAVSDHGVDSGPGLTMRGALARRFTAETAKFTRRAPVPGPDRTDGQPDNEDNDESNRKKSVLLLGKKIFNNLNS